ncbi:glycoside hydrolase family 18, partial [Prolixibacteraceae bacterium]|nr:glycoside hydrolase family 18 [Prolixibacteraceae bacterium]
PYELKAELGKYLDYCICQAYQCSNEARLDGYYNRCTYLEEFTPSKLIVTENFESYWENGGVTFYKDGVEMNSLQGMARWNPKDGRKGGVGTYHMEYEYVHNPDYKYLRDAIQIMNPAVQ